MKKNFLFLLLGLFFNGTAMAQSVDVTDLYIPNAGFEECTALEASIVHDNQYDVDRPVVALPSSFSVAQGYDYAEQGWKLTEQLTGANGGVISYAVGQYIQHKSYNKVGDAGPEAGPDGGTGKALCFLGNLSVLYKQTNEVTLPAGAYRLVVNVWAGNGGTSHPTPTIGLSNCRTGFVTSEGVEYLTEKSKSFKSNGWDTDVIEFELTAATKGRFQISYGNSYFTVVDDLTLEHIGGVATSVLENLITKAKLLDGSLDDVALQEAISVAESVVANPESQDVVTAQVETLYNAMSSALSATSKAVDITAAYLENSSFETGKVLPWKWGAAAGNIGEPTNPESKPYIDGVNVVEFAGSGTNALSQTITHLPAGYYAIDVKLNGKAVLNIGSVKALIQGGANYLYLRVHPELYNLAADGELTIGASSSSYYNVDNFRLFYGKDEASILSLLLQDVKSDAQNVLNNSKFAPIVGSERTKLQEALNGEDIDAINSALNTFVAALDSYAKYEKAKAAAADYTPEVYPYGSRELYEQIAQFIATDAQSASHASASADDLTSLCFKYYVSNAYCEGVDKTDYTEKVVGADATDTSVASAWTKLNMDIRTDKTAWVNPKTNKSDKNVYGVTVDYYRASNGKTAYMYQTIKNLPKGKYVVSVTAMAASSIQPEVLVNNVKIGEIKGVGTYGGGVYGGGWNETVLPFEKEADGDLVLRLQSVGSANYQDWYFDNIRLYRLNDEGVDAIEAPKQSDSTLKAIYDLQGRKVERLSKKGVYIIDGKKIIRK